MPDLAPPQSEHPMWPGPLPAVSSLGLLLERQLSECRRNGTVFSLLWIRLEGLDAARCRCGDAVAERVLRAAWARLRRRIRATDHAVHEEGAAFGVVLTGASQATAAAVLARAICELSAPYWVGTTVVDLRARAGFGAYPEAGETSEALQAAAMQPHPGAMGDPRECAADARSPRAPHAAAAPAPG